MLSILDRATKRINKIRVMTGPHALGPDNKCKYDALYEKSKDVNEYGSYYTGYNTFTYQELVRSYWAGVFWFLPIKLFMKGLPGYKSNSKYRENVFNSYRRKKNGNKEKSK